jgi:hypothetical protein
MRIIVLFCTALLACATPPGSDQLSCSLPAPELSPALPVCTADDPPPQPVCEVGDPPPLPVCTADDPPLPAASDVDLPVAARRSGDRVARADQRW